MPGLVLQMLVLLLEVGFRNFGSGWILGRGAWGVVREIPLSSFFAFCFFFFYILVAVKMHNTFQRHVSRGNVYVQRRVT
jgi:hypothetical protein